MSETKNWPEMEDRASVEVREDTGNRGIRPVDDQWLADRRLQYVPPATEVSLRTALPGLDALLALDAATFGRIIAERPDVWAILSAFLRDTRP